MQFLHQPVLASYLGSILEQGADETVGGCSDGEGQVFFHIVYLLAATCYVTHMGRVAGRIHRERLVQFPEFSGECLHAGNAAADGAADGMDDGSVPEHPGEIPVHAAGYAPLLRRPYRGKLSGVLPPVLVDGLDLGCHDLSFGGEVPLVAEV